MKLVYLSGGVGGARLLTGLDRVLPADALTVVVNTGDDFEHWGLRICPDLDTVMYNLSGLAHPERGWGLREESHTAAKLLERYGAPTWFSLSDADLATHIRRSELLREGHSLSDVTGRLCRALGIERPVLPMTDAQVETQIRTIDGRTLSFQNWFVRERCGPQVARVEQRGTFVDSPQVLNAIANCDAVLIGPSNPYVSIDPILAGSKTRAALAQKPRFAVSPLVGGRAVKGPLADMVTSITGESPSAAVIAAHYETAFAAPLGALIVQNGDVFAGSCPVVGTETVMTNGPIREALARTCLEVIDRELSRA